MALKVTLKASERIIIGGASLKNIGNKATTLLIENEVPLLREKEIMSEKRADTPCRKIYFLTQLMYVDGQNVAQYHKAYWKLAREIIEAAPSTMKMFETISGQIYDGKYYRALKEIRTLIDYEDKVTSNAAKSNRHI
jgi:flagellar protein FlbT